MDARHLILAVLCALAPIGVRAAPLPVQEGGDAMPDSAPEIFAPGPPGSAEALAKKQAAEAQAKQQRLQKIQQLTFDRRASSILKAWATPPDEEDEGEEEGPDAAATATEAPVAASAPAVPRPSMSITSTRAVIVSGGVRRTVVTRVAPPGMVEEVVQLGGGGPSMPIQAATATDETTSTSKDPFDRQLKTFQRNVTLGDWPAAGAFLDELPEDEGKALYTKLVQTLPNPSAPTPQPSPNGSGMVMMSQPVNPQFMEPNVVSHEDVIAITDIAPVELDEALLNGLGRLLSAAIGQGHAVEDFTARAEAELNEPEDQRALTRRQVAKLLMAAGRAVEVGPFLPSIEEAEAEDDREALNLLSRHFLAMHADDTKGGHLEAAWKVNQAVLAVGEVDESEKEQALTRAVELAPQVDEQYGRAWLVESFTDRPDRGMEIIAAIGKTAGQGLQSRPMDTDGRLKALELQKNAVEALLDAAPDRVDDWSEQLKLLAMAWLAEAEHSRQFDTSSSLGPRMMRDPFGNYYYNQPGDESMQMRMMAQNNNMPQPLRVGDVLKVRPEGAWLEQIDEALAPKFATVFAQLYLKVGEDAEAFPFVERLADTHPDRATDLAEEFLRVWTRNHDPNAARSYTNPYYYMYGFERRAESIPLTRSKQERNLEELADWVRRLRALPIGELDEQLLANAFTSSHSQAEVYRVEAIEEVFGSLDAQGPKTLAALVQQMRTNLGGVWQMPATQETAKTRRREQDIRAEVMRGFDVARAVVDAGLGRHPGNYALIQAGAAVEHDFNNYLQQLEEDPGFAPRRLEALDRFDEAADAYAAAVPELSEDEETVDVFQQWFAAGLGAVDLGQIKPEHQADPKQPPKIKAAIESLPGPAAKRHMDMFANSIFNRLSSVGPALKSRYLDAAFAIVGDHPQAAEARKVHDYYKDLITELKLDTHVDGSTDVGSGTPFGLFVDLRHTPEIERESGGFGRYLQNQNAGTTYYYNYGRPLEDYRDKFEEAARRALDEHFVVHSVTFQPEDVHSRATERTGWRVTPYAYVLLEARGPEIDTIPPLRLDLDFLDTSGYVILPIESPGLPIDAGGDADPRPFDHLEITQTLDERQADDGRLILEVKAVAQGLVPELDDLLEIQSEGLNVVEVEDQGLSIARFDPEAEDTVVVSERTWTVDLAADDAEAGTPETFHFATLKVDDAEAIYQRYDDADLAEVAPVIDLQERYGGRDLRWLWATFAAIGLLAIAALVYALRPRRRVEAAERFRVPEPVTPFTVLGLLRDIERHNGFPSPQHEELVATIGNLESHYFLRPGGPEPDLGAIARDWVVRAG